MALDEGLIEDSEEDYSDSDSSHGLNHSEYLILARERMQDERPQPNSQHLSEHYTFESSTPNSNELLRREINDAQEDLQRVLPRLPNLPATRPGLGDTSKNSTSGANRMSLTYPESLELPPACSNASAPNDWVVRPHSCDEDSNNDTGIIDETDIGKLPMLPPPNPSPVRLLSSPRTITKGNNVYDYKGTAVSQHIASPPSPPDSQPSPYLPYSRPRHSEVGDDAILFPPFPVSSSLAETEIISSSMPLDVLHDDHDAVATAIQELPAKTMPEAQRKRKQLVEGPADHEIIAKKAKVQSGNPSLSAELQKCAMLNPPFSPTRDSPPNTFGANEADLNVTNDADNGTRPNRAKAVQNHQVMATKVKHGGILFKQPAFRVGLSKRDRVDSLHAYLRR
ncbi:hypothetical protein V1525DRAFT_208641 [Lipomyces kononenkoae]|uniref:Uncharacterized protein n=1 Tax=Lipomyces kononenkoae TaxID=34357 RepID=A0ACC3T9D0_LIPKO